LPGKLIGVFYGEHIEEFIFRGIYSKQFEMERKMSDEAKLFDAIPEVL